MTDIDTTDPSLTHLEARALDEADELRAEVEQLRAERDEWKESYQLAHQDRLDRSLERDRTIDEREYLKGELAKTAAALTEARRYAAGRDNEIGRLVAENARVRQQRDELKPVVEAAKAWVASSVADFGRTGDALTDAVDALPKAEATR